MKEIEVTSNKRGLARILEVSRALLGFSRALQATFAITQAGLAALIALKGIPPYRIIVLGAVACLSGSYALTALNDMLDLPVDRERFKNLRSYESFDLSSLFIRHPLAQGIINYKIALTWIFSLSFLSMIFIYLLKPWLIIIYPLIASLVILYSFLNRVTPFKTFVIGMVIILGSLAGWLAVAKPNWQLMFLFAFWMLFWEIGGRNIPNDFADAQEDIKIGMKTIPTVYGWKAASYVAFLFLVLTFLTSFILGIALQLDYFYFASAFLAGTFFLIIPGGWLLANPTPETSMKVFNRSCLYPGLIFLLLLVNFWVF